MKCCEPFREPYQRALLSLPHTGFFGPVLYIYECLLLTELPEHLPAPDPPSLFYPLAQQVLGTTASPCGGYPGPATAAGEGLRDGSSLVTPGWGRGGGAHECSLLPAFLAHVHSCPSACCFSSQSRAGTGLGNRSELLSRR